MNAKESLRHIAEHARNLIGAHGGMGAESGKNGLKAVAIVLPCIARQLAGARVLAALVGRHGEHAIALAQLGKALREQIFQLLRRQIGVDASTAQ